jgi:hypothetical protein
MIADFQNFNKTSTLHSEERTKIANSNNEGMSHIENIEKKNTSHNNFFFSGDQKNDKHPHIVKLEIGDYSDKLVPSFKKFKKVKTNEDLDLEKEKRSSSVMHLSICGNKYRTSTGAKSKDLRSY